MDDVGIVIDNHDAAPAFFVKLDMTREGQGAFEGEWVDRDGLRRLGVY